MKTIARIVAPLMMVVCLTVAASAQQPNVYRPPGGSPFSPYMELFRRDRGLLNNYYNHVVPQRQMADRYRQRSAEIDQIRRDVRQVEGAVQGLQRGTIRPTGTVGTFMNYSHYYGGR